MYTRNSDVQSTIDSMLQAIELGEPDSAREFLDVALGIIDSKDREGRILLHDAGNKIQILIFRKEGLV